MKRIAVAGNPNSGKTCIFNNLTGSNQRVGNYAGVTVEFTEGTSKFGGEKVQVIDLPGTYSLTAYSQEEVVARDFIIEEKPDVVVNVLDGSNLERNLYLTTQLLELNVPMVLVLNMYDIVEKKGLSIDTDLLGELLGVKVVKAIASKRVGMDDIKAACLETILEDKKPREMSYPHELEEIIPALRKSVCCHKEISQHYNPLWFTIKLLEDDKIIMEKFNKYSDIENIKTELEKAKDHLMRHSGEDANTAVVEARYAFVNGAYKEVHRSSKVEQKMLTNIIDSIVCHKFLGWGVLIGAIYAMFHIVFEISGEINWIPTGGGEWTSPVGLFEMFFDLLSSYGELIEIPWLQSLVVDGIIGGVGGVMGFIPLIFFMFLFLSFLEDSGYIARVAFILDRVLRTFGLQGKSILALIVSGGIPGGCAVPGIMATRTLREEKDRLVTILVTPFMNCGAKMPVYGVLIAAFFPNKKGLLISMLIFLSWFFALLSAAFLRKFIVKGEQTPFVMELPLYHMPTFRGVLMDTWHRTWMYIRKAATIILAINVILWAMMYYPRMDTSKFDAQREKLSSNFVIEAAKTEFAELFKSDNYEENLETIAGHEDEDLKKVAEDAEPTLKIAAALNKETVQKGVKIIEDYKEELAEINNLEAEAVQAYTFAGRLGRGLEPVSQLAGFDWRDNIALIGGFAAKEVIVSTLGTAYSMGEVETDDTSSLSERLQADETWSPIRAFAMMIFVMVYAPCFVTIAAIKKETESWKWAGFSMVYSTTVGFVLAVIIYQVGSLLF